MIDFDTNVRKHVAIRRAITTRLTNIERQKDPPCANHFLPFENVYSFIIIIIIDIFHL